MINKECGMIISLGNLSPDEETSPDLGNYSISQIPVELKCESCGISRIKMLPLGIHLGFSDSPDDQRELRNFLEDTLANPATGIFWIVNKYAAILRRKCRSLSLKEA